MKSQKIKNIKFRDLGNPAFIIETPPEHIKLSTVLLAIGKRGSGKTYFISNLLHMLPFDRIIVVSSTFDSNRKMMENLNIRDEDILDPNDPDVIQKIYDAINAERDAIVEYRISLQKWKTFSKKINTNRYKLDKIEDEDLLRFYDEFLNDFQKPSHWLNGRKPVIGLFIDDAQNSKIMGTKLSNLVIKNRHLGSFESGETPIGVSIFMALQNYTSLGNGLPKSIRGNATHVAIWRNKNEKELKLMSEELAGEVDKETFMKVYNKVMENPDDKHAMLFVDLAKKDNHPSQFRKNYDEFIIMD